MRMRVAGALIVLLAAAGCAAAQQPTLAVRLVTDEADAVLAILDRLGAGSAARAEDWRRLWETEGYRRLKQREVSLQRPFEDSSFMTFVRSPSLLEQRAALRGALEKWASVDLEDAARAAFAYLPAGAAIRVKVYPSIKPRPNTFVFEPRTDPAIFFYLDPAIPAAKFRNTLVHEFHHIGVASACPETPPAAGALRDLDNAALWLGGFAEGRAMLAAAGGPNVHPHATSDSSERAVWERDVANLERDMRRLEEFFLAVAAGKLGGEQLIRRGMAFINTDTVPQGPYYTVGYVMARTIEAELGRERLVASSCDGLKLLTDYNAAAALHNRRGGSRLPLWSDELLRRLQPLASSRRAT